MIRIIAGRCKGRTLATASDARIRPTTGRVKEALFSMIAPQLPGRAVLDLYAGSGSLGLEALSRGAASALFVDHHRQALELIRENIQRCGFTKESSVLSGQAHQPNLYQILATRHTQTPNTPHGFDLVFLDPPYGQGLAQTTLERLAQSKVLSPDAVIVTEESESVILAPPVGWHPRQSRRYGMTRITLWSRAPDHDQKPPA